MDDTVIRVQNLGKAFKRYERVRHRLLEWLPGQRKLHEERWVLEGLNFTIGRGEAVGLVGRNGAGKSTLLKLLTGTLIPTTGSLDIRGRVVALLELGMAFHPEFSGWHNVMMAGQLQGHDREAILACMDEISAFAEIGDALYQPVRTYSSGMAVRLAFAEATAIPPDILIVDEALAVGDAYFQHKCFRRLQEYRERGVTLIFVSHDPLAIKSLCNRALLIEKGGIAMDADPLAVLDYYNALIAHDEASGPAADLPRIAGTGGMRSGTGEAVIVGVEARRAGQPTKRILEGEALTLEIAVEIRQPLPQLTIGIMLRDRLGNEVFGTNTQMLGLESSLTDLRSNEKIRLAIEIPDFHLGAGSYGLTVAAHGPNDHLSGNFDWWDQAITLEVGQGCRPPFTGVTRLPLQAKIARESPA